MAGQNISHEGHRQRMRAGWSSTGWKASHPTRHWNICSTSPTPPGYQRHRHALLERFGSFAGVLEASEEELCRVPGVGPASARMLHLLPR